MGTLKGVLKIEIVRFHLFCILRNSDRSYCTPSTELLSGENWEQITNIMTSVSGETM